MIGSTNSGTQTLFLVLFSLVFSFGFTPDCAQVFLLAVSLGITSGRTWGTTCGAGDQTLVICMQDKDLILYTIFLAPGPLNFTCNLIHYMENISTFFWFFFPFTHVICWVGMLWITITSRLEILLGAPGQLPLPVSFSLISHSPPHTHTHTFPFPLLLLLLYPLVGCAHTLWCSPGWHISALVLKNLLCCSFHQGSYF